MPLDNAGGAPVLHRMYALLDVRSFDDDQRVIRGIATTATPDRMGDVVEPRGIQFKNPLPLLWQHDPRKPVGTCTFAPATEAGIAFEASLPKIAEAGALKDRVDEAWQCVKLGLVRGVSIGFREIEYSRMDTGGYRYLASEVLELSLVTIPANADATITTVRTIDAATRAAHGTRRAASTDIPGVSGDSTTHPKAPKMKTVREQIAAFEATRQAKAARLQDIMAKAAEAGETLAPEQAEEYDGLETEIRAIDAHLKRLGDMEKLNLAKATPVEHVIDPASASRVRAAIPAQVRASKQLSAGLGFTRYTIALARARGARTEALAIASNNEQWRAETPEVEAVLRAAVAAGTTTDTTWASALVQYQNMASEFIDYLRPKTLIGRLPGLRYVPFKVKIPRQTGTSTAAWVGEGQVKPVSALAFDSVTLDVATISDIVVFTAQLAQLSQPSVEMLVRDDLAKKIINFMDAQFIDPTVASTGVSPASITYGVSPTVATGTTADALRTDIGTLIDTFMQVNSDMEAPVWITHPTLAAKIGLIRSSLGTKEYPEINFNGGMLEGFPVVTTTSVPATGGSPTDGYPLILLNATDILIADDGQVRIDASAEATLQMDTAPDSPTTGSTNLLSLWQQGMVGIKADRDINWAKRRSTCVAFISNAKYTTG